MHKKLHTLIVGGGWAGLSAAVTLAHKNHQVTVLEAAPQLGGRARGVPFGDLTVDNGQHLFLGAYRSLLKLYRIMGLNPEDYFERTPLALQLYSQTEKPLCLKPGKLPAPLHLLSGLFNLSRVSLAEKLSTLKFSHKLLNAKKIRSEDISVYDFLTRAKQPKVLIEKLWGPLCLAALTTPMKQASAAVFLQVLKDSFLFNRRHSDFLFAKKDLSQIFPEPAQAFIESKGGTVRCHARVTDLIITRDTCHGVYVDGKPILADQVILALPSKALSKLMAPHPQFIEQKKYFEQYEYAPITTVYLQYDETARLPHPLIGFEDSEIHWVFDRHFAQQPGLMAAVISGHSPLQQVNHDTLAQATAETLAHYFPELGPLKDSKVITEKQAALHCTPEALAQQLSHQTSVKHCHLAGDFTIPYYPSTLESAVRSGMVAAKHIQQQRYLCKH